jgi:hypothetical protein
VNLNLVNNNGCCRVDEASIALGESAPSIHLMVESKEGRKFTGGGARTKRGLEGEKEVEIRHESAW